MKRHDCANLQMTNKGNGWGMCVVCDGRFHLPGCTSKRNKHKDCCEARHQMLWDAGQKVGLFDESVPMLPY